MNPIRVRVRGIVPSKTTYHWRSEFSSQKEMIQAYENGIISYAIPGIKFRKHLRVDEYGTIHNIPLGNDDVCVELDSGVGDNHVCPDGVHVWDTVCVWVAKSEVLNYTCGAAPFVKTGYQGEK